jgi:hypothetical protein
MVRIFGIYLFKCSMRKHLRRAARKVFNRPAPATTSWSENGVVVEEGTQRTKVIWEARGRAPFPMVEGY